VKVVVVANAGAGRGRAARTARAVADAARARGWHAEDLPLDADDGTRARVLEGARAAVVVGGDGTVRSFAARAARLGVPLAIAPAGTENLAAREFGFTRGVDGIVRAIARGAVRAVDLGVAIDPRGRRHEFLVMLSAGLDADVVHDLAARRRGPIGRLSYLGPMLRAALGWVPPTVDMTAPGGATGPTGRGQVLVANSRQYALRLDPARGADPCDGALDALVLPASGWWSLVAWAARLAVRRDAAAAPAAVRSPSWTLRFDRPTLLQADGDPVPFGAVGEVEVRVVPGAVRLVDMRA
jgi:diacylglycerol kinase (ATP)